MIAGSGRQAFAVAEYDADELAVKSYIHRLFPSDNARFVMTCGKCGLEVSKEDLYYRHLPDDLHRAWETIEGLLYYE